MTHVESMQRLGVVVLVGMLLAACTGDPEPLPETRSPGVTTTPSSTPSGRSATVADAFIGRQSLPSCGTIDLAPDWTELRSTDRDARSKVECLTGAKRAVGAELQVTHYTQEGEQIRYYYRNEPGDYGYYVFVDSTDDSYRSGSAWRGYPCDGVSFARGDVRCDVE